MKKVVMVEKVTFFCDICGDDTTNNGRNICQICGRDNCSGCQEVITGSKDMLIGICPICNNMYDKFKKEMNDCYFKYDELYEHDVTKILDEWKEESLLIENKGD